MKLLLHRVFVGFVSVSAVCFSLYTNAAADADVAKGKYLVEIGGCNDCHTAGYAPSGGAIPSSEWLLGDGLGFRGPWGTTYAINLREYMAKLSEEQWLEKAKTLKARPPMPWWAVNAMNEDDLKSLYRFVKSLKPVASSVPSYVPPGTEPRTAFVLWPSPPPQ